MSDETSALELARADLRREQKKVALMQEVGRALSSGLELDPLLVLIMDKVTQLMDGDRSTLYLMSDDGKALWSKVVQGGEVVEIRLAVGEGLAGWVASSGETVNLPDAYADPRFQPSVDQRSGYRTRSILGVPMRDSLGQIVGVLQVLNKADGPFVAADEELLIALANQAAIAIENAKLYHSVVQQNVELVRARGGLEQSTRELNALYEVEQELSAATDLDGLLQRIVARATVVGGARAGSIALREGDRLRFLTTFGPAAAQLAGRTLGLGEGVIGWTVTHRTAVIVNDPANDQRHATEFARDLDRPPRALMAAPLIDGDEVLGGIEILDRADGEGFDESDLRLLVLIAGQVAKAISLARSRNEASVRDRLASIGQLLAGILHDLKTPMTIISGYAQLMAACDEADQREKYVAQILRQFDVLHGMTREVLAFARGDVDLVIRKVYLHRFLEELVTHLQAAVAGRGIEVRLEAGYDGVAFFDEAKLLRVFHNLGRNASEAMTSGGTLVLGSALDGDSMVLSIRDDGPGIPLEIQGRLFELFASGRKGGTGLGLAIVKKIIDDHQGRIDWVTGATGTTFRISLPRERPEAVPAAEPGGGSSSSAVA